MYDDSGLDFGDVSTEDSGNDMPPEVEEVFSSPAQPPNSPKKDNKKRNRMIAIIAVALVVIIAAGAVAVPAIIRAVNPKAQVAAALAKTFDYVGFGDVADIAAGLQKSRFRQDFSLRLGDQYPAALGWWGQENLLIDADAFAGTGLTYSLALDREARQAALSMGVDLGLYHAGDLQLFVDNNTLSIGSPELTNRKFYSVNTETLGADWVASPFFSTMEGVDSTLSFNLFDELATKQVPLVSDATVKQFAQAAATLNEAATVVKDGDIYTMTIPSEVAQAYLDTLIQTLKEDGEFMSRLPADTEFFPYGGDVFSVSSDIVILFLIEKGMVTRMDVPLPDDNNDTAFIMECSEGKLFFSLDRLTPDGQDETIMSATVTISADKAGKQFHVALPDIIITAEGETLALACDFSMEPLEEFDFTPGTPIPLMALDQNGVLSLLLEALGGLQTITEEMSTH